MFTSEFMAKMENSEILKGILCVPQIKKPKTCRHTLLKLIYTKKYCMWYFYKCLKQCYTPKAEKIPQDQCYSSQTLED